LISLAKVAEKTGRYLALLGRSLENMVSVARLTGHWPDDIEVVDPRHIGYLPANEVLAVATGSQGEPRAALSRLAKDSHPWLNLDRGDTVVFSSMIIPGNEKPIERLLDIFKSRNIKTILSEHHDLPIHASGHPNQQELAQLYQWLTPEIAVPTHGEDKHMEVHGRIAREQGVRKVFTGRNGDLFRFSPQPSVRRGVISVGRKASQRD
jgi:ribonuclease J